MYRLFRNAAAWTLPAAPLVLSACGGAPSTEPPDHGAAGGGPGPARVALADGTEASGLDFVHVAGAEGAWALTEIMGGGGALVDVDGDGDLDVVLLAGAERSSDPASPQSGSGHALFRNDGRGRFIRAASVPALEALRGYAMGIATGDVDGDGHVDLYVTQFGRDALLLGDGDGGFEDASEAFGAGTPGWSTSAAFVDFDADGDLDLYVTRYIELDPGQVCHDSVGRRTYCPPASGPAVHDVLLENVGGRFVASGDSSPFVAAARPGLGVVCDDFTGDGRPDIYVANDGQANQLWVRQDDGSWRDEAGLRAVALNHNGHAEASMGVIAEDFDGDGRVDLFMTHLQEETHTLYMARATGMYRDRTGPAGLGVITRPATGFGVAAFDLELDGDLDLAIAQGRVRIGPVHARCGLEGVWGQLAEPNALLLGDRDGRFRAAPASALTDPVTVDRCVLAGDLDGDGDVDLVMTRNEGAVQVLINGSKREGSWLCVDPRSTEAGATTLGVRVTATSGRAPVAQTAVSRTTRASDGYQSSRDPRVHLGLPGSPESVDVTLRWPDGTEESFSGLSTNAVHRLVRGAGASR